MWNKKLLCALHHVMEVSTVERKTIVRTASRDGGEHCGIQKLLCAVCTASRDGGEHCGIQNCCAQCALHHVMEVSIVESKTVVRTASRDGGEHCGTKNYCAHCIT